MKYHTFYIGLLLFLLAGNISAKAQNGKGNGLLPAPVSVTYNKGNFLLNARTSMVLKDTSAAATGTLLSQRLAGATGRKWQLQYGAGKKNTLCFSLNKPAIDSIGNEGYELKVLNDRILIEANTPAGWFYAMETLLQFLPVEPDASLSAIADKMVALPCMHIIDYPRFQWRGLMLDVSRHFFSKDAIKNYVRQMAKYKLNTLHLHLTDNQGWRLEIKSLPLLTDVGAWRVPRTGYWKGFKAPQPGEKATDGGYYTQDDIREIIAYAGQHFVTVVPEIDVPGHSLALIASYPNLSCTQTPQQVLAGDPWNKNRTNVLCVGNDSVYMMLEKIITEVAVMFPAEYIHIGGDEVTRDYWQHCPRCEKLMKKEGIEDVEALQSYFIKRVAAIVEGKGKKVMGWYEKLKGGMAPGSAVMSWKSYEGGILASQNRQYVVMTPAKYTYLDFYQGDVVLENGPFSTARFSTFYQFQPVPPGADARYILGGQGCLWTEQVSNERKMQEMTWPRSMALAEILWSPEKRSWDDFITDVEKLLPRFDKDNVRYSKAFYEPVITGQRVDGILKVKINTEVKGLNVYYSFDDTSPDSFYPEYKNRPLDIPEGAHHIRVVSYKNGKQVGREINLPLSELPKRITP